MNTDQPDELQKAETPETDKVRLMIAAGDWCKESDCTNCALSHAEQLEKQLRQVQAELKQEKIWKVEDPRMLREQMRVHDVAFQHLHEQHKSLQESLHYANGVADLAMKHRDSAEQERDQLKAAVIEHAFLFAEMEGCLIGLMMHPSDKPLNGCLISEASKEKLQNLQRIVDSRNASPIVQSVLKETRS